MSRLATKARRRVSIGAVRSPQTETAILKAAAQLLEEDGYRGFTIDAVVKRAGSSKPTVYRWWRNKASLIMEVYERAGEATLGIPDTGDLERDLAQYLEAIWTWWASSRSGEALRSFITEAQLDSVSVDELREGFLTRRERPLNLIFSRAVERGEISADASVVQAGVSLLVGISWLHLLTNDLDKTDKIDAAVKLIVCGILSRESLRN